VSARLAASLGVDPGRVFAAIAGDVRAEFALSRRKANGGGAAFVAATDSNGQRWG
jgi:hypothetical protein